MKKNNKSSSTCAEGTVMGSVDKEKEAALVEELTLLGNMMKLHEWTRFGQKEAAEEEELEVKLDSEAYSLKIGETEGN